MLISFHICNTACYTCKNLTTCQQDVFNKTTCGEIFELQDDNKLLEQLATSLLSSTTLWQVANKLLTTCQHPVDKLLEQHCYKSAAGLLQLVRFYVTV